MKKKPIFAVLAAGFSLTLHAIVVLSVVAVSSIAMAFTSPDSRFYYSKPSYIPVFMERSELEKSVIFENQPREMIDPGKIYVRGNEIFINEKYKGVHIIDNSNPFEPTPKSFISVPGCIDMAVKGNIMYMDNAVDLIAFDLETQTVTERIKDLLPEHLSPDGISFKGEDRPEEMILIGWKKNTDL